MLTGKKRILSAVLSGALLAACAVSAPAWASAATDPIVELEGNYVVLNEGLTWRQLDTQILSDTGYYITDFPTSSLNTYVQTDQTAEITRFNGEPFSVEMVVMGDINGDGYFTSQDYQSYIDHIHTHVLNGAKRKACDMNRDGIVDAGDKLLLKEKVRYNQWQIVMAVWGNQIVDAEPGRTIGDFLYSAGYLKGLNGSGTLYDKDLNNVTDQLTGNLENGMIYSCNNTLYRVIIYGDVDCDGIITISDVMQISRIAAGSSCEDYVREAADCNMDGMVDASDAQEAARLIAYYS